ncbi:MAG: AsmA family protein, partial [Azoarcus sp.]|nr:AsmA family protein [Azoarcus sp.]
MHHRPYVRPWPSRQKRGRASLACAGIICRGGSLERVVHLDGRKAQMREHARLKARQLGLKKLFPGFEPMQTSLGEANGEVDLRGTGNSIAALLGSADGE